MALYAEIEKSFPTLEKLFSAAGVNNSNKDRKVGADIEPRQNGLKIFTIYVYAHTA